MLSAVLIRLTNQQGDNYHTLCVTDTEVRAEKAAGVFQRSGNLQGCVCVCVLRGGRTGDEGKNTDMIS